MKAMVDVCVHAVTADALLVSDDGEEAGAVWVPLSQVDEDSEIGRDSEAGDEGELVIPEWLATDRGLT